MKMGNKTISGRSLPERFTPSTVFVENVVHRGVQSFTLITWECLYEILGFC